MAGTPGENRRVKELFMALWERREIDRWHYEKDRTCWECQKRVRNKNWLKPVEREHIVNGKVQFTHHRLLCKDCR